MRSFSAGEAGTVTYEVSGTTLRLIHAVPAAGWVVEVEQAGGFELDLDFRSGTRRVQVDVEFEDGGIRERVRIRDDADDSRTEITNGVVARVEPADEDEDRSGRRDGDDEDRSGRRDGDDHDDDDGGR